MTEVVASDYRPERARCCNSLATRLCCRFRDVTRDVAPVEVYAKAEWYNPGGSVKDRAALGDGSGWRTPGVDDER